MMRAMWSSASGMKAQQVYIDVIANNLANVNTPGFKRSHVQFQDLIYDQVRGPGSAAAQGGQTPSGLQVGHGVKVAATEPMFTAGRTSVTERALDVMIEGKGFFQVELPDGTPAFTRNGNLSVNAQGRVVTADGLPVIGFDSIEQDASDISIGPDGTLATTVSGRIIPKGQITIYRFLNASGLKAVGRSLFTATESSGEAEGGVPGTSGFGSLRQGALELSNVEVVEEMVNLIVAQRAYEVNTKSIQASDDMLQMANNLKR